MIIFGGVGGGRGWEVASLFLCWFRRRWRRPWIDDSIGNGVSKNHYAALTFSSELYPLPPPHPERRRWGRRSQKKRRHFRSLLASIDSIPSPLHHFLIKWLILMITVSLQNRPGMDLEAVTVLPSIGQIIDRSPTLKYLSIYTRSYLNEWMMIFFLNFWILEFWNFWNYEFGTGSGCRWPEVWRRM